MPPGKMSKIDKRAGTFIPDPRAQGLQTLIDKSNFDIMVRKIGQISKVKIFP